MTFKQRLEHAWLKNNSLLCIGLDPDLQRMPQQIANKPDAVFEFCRSIIDATADLVCAFKPQIAHFAALEAEDSLKRIIEHIKQNYSDVLIILDSKRSDIGSTAQRYAVEAFDRYKADAVTVNPYLGIDGVQPFLDYKDKGVILLCRTSNPSARDFQDLIVAGKPLYQHVAQTVANKWDKHQQCMLVVGATYPKELGAIRKLTGNMPFLVPGVGVQGGDVAQVIQHGCTKDQNNHHNGLVISSSREILYAGQAKDFASKARDKALALVNTINKCRT